MPSEPYYFMHYLYNYELRRGEIERFIKDSLSTAAIIKELDRPNSMPNKVHLVTTISVKVK